MNEDVLNEIINALTAHRKLTGTDLYPEFMALVNEIENRREYESKQWDMGHASGFTEAHQGMEPIFRKIYTTLKHYTKTENGTEAQILIDDVFKHWKN